MSLTRWLSVFAMSTLMLLLSLMVLLAAPARAQEYTPCVDEIGLIGADGVNCWRIADYEALYGNPAWYVGFLTDLGVLTHNQHMEWIIRYTWPDHLEDGALALARCESGLNPAAGNFTGRDLSLNNGSVGLFRQGVKFWPARAAAAGVGGSDIRDPYANAVVSAWLQQVGGWGHWLNCSRKVGLL